MPRWGCYPVAMEDLEEEIAELQAKLDTESTINNICHWCNKKINKKDGIITFTGEIAQIVNGVCKEKSNISFHHNCWSSFNYIGSYIEHNLTNSYKKRDPQKLKKLPKSDLDFYLLKVFVLEAKNGSHCNENVYPNNFMACPICGCLLIDHTGNMAEYPENYSKSYCRYCEHILWMSDNSLPTSCYSWDNYEIDL